MRLLLAMLLAVAFPPAVAAQAPPRQQTSLPSPADAWLVDAFTTEDGLPQNSVRGIARTSDGYLWIATLGGLARYDGVQFTPILREDSSGPRVDRIIRMAVGLADTLWMATEAGLLSYAGGKFRQWGLAEGLPALPATTIHALPAGGVWVGTPEGIHQLEDDGTFTLVHPRLGAVFRDAHGLVWIMWAERGALAFREAEDGELVPDPLWHGGLAFIHDGANGSRWLLSGDEALIVEADTIGRVVQRFTRADGLTRPRIVALGRGGDIWVGNQGGGIQLLTPKPVNGRRVHPVVPDLSDIHHIYVDPEGTVWVGTDQEGLIRIRRRLFDVAGPTEGDLIAVNAILEDSRGRVFMGTACKGTWMQERPQAPWVPIAPLNEPLACVTSYAEGEDGSLWAGGYGPLQRYRDGRATPVRDSGGRTVGNVIALYRARDGTMWAGRYNAGLHAFAPDASFLKSYGAAEGLRNLTVTYITSDSTGAIWFATSGGIGRLRNDSIAWFDSRHGVPAAQARALLPEPDGTLWIGTYGGGLARMKNGRVVVIRQHDGLGDDVVSSITADGLGHFWLTGNRGVVRVRRAELEAIADGRADRVHSILFGRDDGLVNSETNGGFQPAAMRGSDGRLWFPTLRGAAVVDPTRADVAGLPPPARVEAVTINGRRVTTLHSIQIPKGRPTLEVHYTGLSFVAPKHIVFRYRLVGYDDDWVEAGSRRVAYYPRLSHGRYRFQVMAANRNGVWGDLATLPLRVPASLHETLWFRFTLALMALGVVAWMAWVRVSAARRAQAQQQAFARALIERQETERRRIAGELHDGLGQDLLLVKNYTALALSSDEARARGHLEQIGSIATSAIAAVRSLARDLTPRQLDHVGLTEALDDLVRTAGDASTVRFTASIAPLDGCLTPDARLGVFRIVQEAVTNIIKHAEASSAYVGIERAEGVIRMTIRDNGRGMDAAAARRGGFGLDGLRERVAMLGGSLGLRSAPGQGTRIEIVVPESANTPGPVVVPPGVSLPAAPTHEQTRSGR